MTNHRTLLNFFMQFKSLRVAPLRFAAIAIASLSAVIPAAAQSSGGSVVSEPTKVLVYDMNEAGSKYYRIPALVTAADGSLVALADKRGDRLNDLPNTISVVAKRSTDGGRTWSEAVTIAQGDADAGTTYGDPAVVLDRNTGNLVAVFSGDTGFFVSTKTNRAGFYVSTSSDNGLTWTAPRAITDQIYQSSWYGAFAASGSMLQTADGTIMFVANTRLSSAQWVTDVYEFVCASSDGGQTWSVLNADSRIPADGQGNESKLVELEDGTLLMSIRSSANRRFSKSTDGGRTWTAATASSMPDPSCNGDIILYPSTDGQSRLLHSIPANSTTRQDVTVYMSYDNGATWPVSKKLVDGVSAYSSLTVLEDGSIGCLVEEGKWDSNIAGEDGFKLYYMNFTLDWLTDGGDNGDSDLSEIYDGTLNCDGSRYMTIARNEAFDIPAGGTMTITAKVYLDEFGAHRGLISNRWSGSTSNNNDATGFELFGGNSSDQAFSNNVNLNKGSWNNIGHGWCTGLNTGRWAHVAWVYDGANGTSKLYINGALKNTVTKDDLKNYPVNPQADILVGARYLLVDNAVSTVDMTGLWKGKIDDVRFYSTALSQFQVISDLSSTVDASTADLIAAYDFSEIKGYTVTDISGHGHDGTLVGFPENAEGLTLTITEPTATEGTLEVFNGETKLASGRKVASGTELRVVATPVEPNIVKSITVNGTPLEVTDNTATFTITEASTVAAEFERDPDNKDYCTIPSTITPSGPNARGYSEFIISDNNGNSQAVPGIGTGSSRPMYADRTATKFVTTAGATLSFTGTTTEGKTWMHSYLYIDFGNDGVFDVDPANEGANGDLIVHTGYNYTKRHSNGSDTADPTTKSDGSAVNHNDFFDIPDYTLPADIAPGEYRFRYKIDWNSTDPCGRTDASHLYGMQGGNFIQNNNGSIIDFTLVIESNDFENERTVRVYSNNEALGTVAITNPATEGSSVTTKQKAVEVTATAKDHASFINWTNATGAEITTEPVYIFNEDRDATFYANFGFTITCATSTNGSVAMTAKGQPLASGDVVKANTEVTLVASPDAGYAVSKFTINGENVTMTNNEYTFVPEANSAIEIEFAEASYNLQVTTEGQGDVLVATAGSPTKKPTGTETLTSGSTIPNGSNVRLFVRPAQGYKLGTVTYIPGTGAEEFTTWSGTARDCSWEDEAGYVYLPGLTKHASKGDYIINVTFTNTSAIDDIFADEAEGETEYFNLQGMRVAAENLTNGFYIVRKGNRTAKVYINK